MGGGGVGKELAKLNLAKWCGVLFLQRNKMSYFQILFLRLSV